MSHSPTEDTSVRESFDTQHEYNESIRRLNDMVADGFSWSGREKNCVFLNTRDGRYATISAISGIDFADDGRAHALVDWDHDGDLDVWSTNRLAPQVRFLRNDSRDGNHFVSLQLQGNGRTTNRDGIGARVEVRLGDDPQHARRVKTLHAGEGFMGQSSKTLTFGLGESTIIEEVLVHWPGGASESFNGVEVDGIFRLAQGNGLAQLVQPPQREVQLTDAPLNLPSGNGASRAVLWSRIPVPSLSYENYEHDSETIRTRVGQPLLINLWSPTCVPCIQELNEFTTRATELRAKGLNVLALTTSGIGSDTSTLEQAQHTLERVGFPFDSGQATLELLDRLQDLHDIPFTMNMPMAQPTSFLVTGDGQLAAIYRGRVEVDIVLADLSLLELQGDDLLRKKCELPGTWFEMPRAVSSYIMALRILEGGQAMELDQYLQANWNQLQALPQFPGLLVELAELHKLDGNFELAAARLRQALELDPASGMLHLQLARVAEAQEDDDQALQEFQLAAELDPESPLILTALGLQYYKRNDLEQGLRFLNLAIAVGPRDVQAREKLIAILLLENRFEQALPHRIALLRFSSAPLLEHQAVIYDLYLLGRLEEAKEELEFAIQRFPNSPVAMNDLAWFLASVPESSLRDGERAVEMAARSLQTGHQDDFHTLDALAAALAEAGQFELATETAQRAAILASATGDPGLALRIARRAESYGVEQPYRVASPQAVAKTLELPISEGMNDDAQELPQFLTASLDFHRDLSERLNAMGHPQAALAELRHALYRYPESPVAMNNLAWFLATSPQDELRSGQEAVQLAKQARDMLGEVYGVLDTLAVAYAESGDFEQAVATAQRAISLANEAEDRATAAEIESHLEFFHRGQPFHGP